MRKTFQEVVDEILARSGLTLTALAERLEVNRTTLWRWVTGETPVSYPSHRIRTLAATSGIDIEELKEWLGIVEYDHPKPEIAPEVVFLEQLIESLKSSLQTQRRYGVLHVGDMRQALLDSLKTIDEVLWLVTEDSRRYELLSLKADFLIELILTLQIQKVVGDSWKDVMRFILILHGVGSDMLRITESAKLWGDSVARARSIINMAHFERGNVLYIRGQYNQALRYLNCSIKTDFETVDSGRTVAIRAAMVSAAHLGDTVLVDRYKDILIATMPSMPSDLIPSCLEAISRSAAVLGRVGESDTYYGRHSDSLIVLEQHGSTRLPVRTVQKQLNLLARGVWFADPSIHRDVDIEAIARNVVQLSTRHGYLRHAEMAVSHFAFLANLSKEEAKILLMPKK